MRKSLRVFTDLRTGKHFVARTVKELRSQIANGSSRVRKMYRDTSSGTFHVGYVIGQCWLEMDKSEWKEEA
ncbi:hypothetical protein [Selenomonas ruminantium]|uniref:hypothetical protein n=1 Tax=Selenomonas ruminantium TaxID=971 RepID=UPI0026E9E7B5|nr:hypothetical protein [Selenomonas ruminantium]